MDLFGPGQKQTNASPPQPTPPPRMPDPLSPDVIAANRRQTAEAGRYGRQSTVLTTAPARAAGTLAGSYGASKLGAST